MDSRAGPRAPVCIASPALDRLVFGVHWTPSKRGAQAADLDALCLAYDASNQLLETIHGGCPRNANDSIVHTGDSRDGANHWDDERIFVFAEALPPAVRRLAFIVACADGRDLCEVPGATCHITDAATEREWLRVDLSALRGHRSHLAATLRRTGRGWAL